MPPFSTSKALTTLLSRRNGIGRLIRFTKTTSIDPFKFDHTRCLSCGNIAGIYVPTVQRPLGSVRVLSNSLCSERDGIRIHKRRFIGWGDDDEPGVLSKVYEERRVLGYSPVQLFDVVAAVDLYQDFVPWCQRSEILKSYPDGSFDAELEIGFKFLVESYVSHVELQRPNRVKVDVFSNCSPSFITDSLKVAVIHGRIRWLQAWPSYRRYLHLSSSGRTTVSQSSLFDHLINVWQFNPGPIPGTCSIYFLVDFKFQSPLYRQVASMFFKEVVSQLVASFNERCRLIYGPGVPIQQDAYSQGA